MNQTITSTGAQLNLIKHQPFHQKRLDSEAVNLAIISSQQKSTKPRCGGGRSTITTTSYRSQNGRGTHTFQIEIDGESKDVEAGDNRSVSTERNNREDFDFGMKSSDKLSPNVSPSREIREKMSSIWIPNVDFALHDFDAQAQAARWHVRTITGPSRKLLN